MQRRVQQRSRQAPTDGNNNMLRVVCGMRRRETNAVEEPAKDGTARRPAAAQKCVFIARNAKTATWSGG